MGQKAYYQGRFAVSFREGTPPTKKKHKSQKTHSHELNHLLLWKGISVATAKHHHQGLSNSSQLATQKRFQVLIDLELLPTLPPKKKTGLGRDRKLLYIKSSLGHLWCHKLLKYDNHCIREPKLRSCQSQGIVFRSVVLGDFQPKYARTSTELFVCFSLHFLVTLYQILCNMTISYLSKFCLDILLVITLARGPSAFLVMSQNKHITKLLNCICIVHVKYEVDTNFSLFLILS